MLRTKCTIAAEHTIRKRRRVEETCDNGMTPLLDPIQQSPNGFIVVPDFHCPAVHHNNFTRIQLSMALSDANSVILFFYGCDFTSTARSDLDLISTYFDSFQTFHAMPIAISPDTEAVHHAFINHPMEGLTKRPEFPLRMSHSGYCHLTVIVADTTRAVSQSFGMVDVLNGLFKRSVFIIDKQRRIRFSFVLDDDRIPHSMETILTMLKMLA